MAADAGNSNSDVFDLFSIFVGARCAQEEAGKEKEKRGLVLATRRNGRISVTAYIRHFNEMSASDKLEVLQNGGANAFFAASYRLQQATPPFRSSGGVNSWLHNAIIFTIRALGSRFDEWWSEKNTEVELFEPNDTRTHVQLGSKCGAGVPLRGFADFWCVQRMNGKMAIIDVKTSVKQTNALSSVANKLKHIQQLRVYALLARWLLLDNRYTPACYIVAINTKRSDCVQMVRVIFLDDFRTIEQAINVNYDPKAVIKRLEEIK